MVLQNLKLNGKKVVWEAHKPIGVMIDAHQRNLWRQSLGTLRTFKWSFFKRQLELICKNETKTSGYKYIVANSNTF